MDIELLAHRFYDHSKYIRGRSRPTIRGYRAGIGQYIKHAGITNLKDVTNRNIRDFLLAGRVEKNWQAGTYLLHYRSLNVFFTWCISNQYLQTNPLQGIEQPRLERRLPIKLNKQDALKLLEVVYNYPYKYQFLRYRNHAIFAMFIFAGLRKNELLNLRLADVDVENLTVFVYRGKGNKDRIIPMSYTLVESLKRYLAERKRLNKTCAHFFVSLNRDVGFTINGLDRLVDKMIKASKLKFTVHKLRHTFATLMLEGGCDIYSLSRMMGHSDIKTTTIYLSASAEHLRSQVSKHPLNDLVRFG